MPIDPQAQSFLDGMIAAGGPPLHLSSVEEARAVPEMFPELLGPGPECTHVRDVVIPGPAGDITARIYEPVDDPPATLVYWHGGGWVLGSARTWDACVRSLAKESGARIVSADYRLAPEHPYPAAVEDAYAATCWAAEQFDGPLAVGGDSAGANLATVVCLRARDENGPKIDHQMLIYPCVDASMSSASMEEFAESELILNRLGMQWFWDHYVPDVERRSEPWASPINAESLAGLPPAYVLICGYDPLRDENEAYVKKLEADGVKVTVGRFPDQIHAFWTLQNAVGGAVDAHRDAAKALLADCGCI